MTANGMGDDLLQVGQRLTIPTAGEAQAQPAATDSTPAQRYNTDHLYCDQR